MGTNFHMNLIAPPELGDIQHSEGTNLTPNATSFTDPSARSVISRDSNSEPVSRYGDTVWDFRAYQQLPNKDASRIIFDNYPEGLRDEVKQLFYLVLFSPSTPAEKASLNTIFGYGKAIRKLCYFANNRKLSIFETLGSKILMKEFLSQINSLTSLNKLSSLTNRIRRTWGENCHKEIVCIADLRAQLIASGKFNPSKQHAVIPPRIFSNFITEVGSFLSEAKPHIKSICLLAEEIPKLQKARWKTRPGLRAKVTAATDNQFALLAEQFECGELLKTNNAAGKIGFIKYLRLLQNACFYQTLIYSGMRRSEATSLTQGCLRVVGAGKQRQYFLDGYTTKLTGIKKVASWVTNNCVADAIEILERLSESICKAADLIGSPVPLFISPSYIIRSTESNQKRRYLQITATRDSIGSCFSRRDSAQFLVNEEDFMQLEEVDPFRAWQTEENFRVGATWQFTPHQIRRSLSFYVAQSGLVSLPSLKRQLKHVSSQMTLHYARTGTIAERYDGNQHFAREVKNSKPKADSIALQRLSKSAACDMSGGAAKSILDRSTSDSLGSMIQSREALVRSFKNGDIAYQTTALGACLVTGECKSRMSRVITACLSCHNAVIQHSSLDTVINRQELFVTKLKDTDDGTVELRSAEAELQALYEYKAKVKKAGGSK